MDPVEFMMLNRIIDNQHEVASRLDENASLRSALADERERNARLLDIIAQLEDRVSSKELVKKLTLGAYEKLKAERDELAQEVATQRATIAERDRTIQLYVIQKVFDQALKSGYIAQVEALKADNPESKLGEVAEVPGHPDLPRRSELRLIFDEAYSAVLRSVGATKVHLQAMADAGRNFPEPIFLDREPIVPSEEQVTAPGP